MLAARFTQDTALPFPGSEGYLRGTGVRVRVLQRNHRPSPGGERTCMVKVFELVRGVWREVLDADGTRTVEERDLYADREAALHGGRKPRRSRRTRRARVSK